MGVFVGGKGVKMDASWEVKPFTYELTWFWYANDSKDRSKLDRILFGRVMVGRNASAAGEKKQAGAPNSNRHQLKFAPKVTVSSEFYNFMMKKEKKEKKIEQHSF